MKEKANFISEMDFPYRRAAENGTYQSSAENYLPYLVDYSHTARVAIKKAAL